MRGAGKSSLGLHASTVLSMAFHDIDVAITHSHGPIPHLVTTHGWNHFRNLELRTLQHALSLHPRNTIIASGGGIVETAAAREFLKEHVRSGGVVVHMKRDLAALFEYLKADRTRKTLRDDPEGIWERRREWYEECAGLCFLAGSMAEKKGFGVGNVAEEKAREEFCWFLEGLRDGL
jgi:pentafunctional AROM polypeptide